MISALLLAAALAIPGNFLLYEKDAAKKDDNPETTWTVSARKSAKLVVNPCDKAALGARGRTAAKTITYTAVPDFAKYEQVILYSSEGAAAAAMSDLRAALRACGTKGYRFKGAKALLGDDGLMVIGQTHQGAKPAIGGERAIVARRANALILYSQAGEWGKPAKADFKQQTGDAKRMLAKICDIAACD
ncbi:hypothetical protein HII36_35735 [Nonomuraea sp. NN258]|uniref:hypothetical protein n=1 Tax=Nonomuraea antri TaxID=2730852 RepID=UPI001569F921|nr:hypothetical protein [Nonomuraea antri]NRQ37149.1 hypothetical protein [Nonomuraea antri]